MDPALNFSYPNIYSINHRGIHSLLYWPSAHYKSPCLNLNWDLTDEIATSYSSFLFHPKNSTPSSLFVHFPLVSLSRAVPFRMFLNLGPPAAGQGAWCWILTLIMGILNSYHHTLYLLVFTSFLVWAQHHRVWYVHQFLAAWTNTHNILMEEVTFQD